MKEGKGHKEVTLPFGAEEVKIKVPKGTEVLKMAEEHPLPDPEGKAKEALQRPIGTPPLREIVAKGKPEGLRVAIAVFDITRPVPYKAPKGILQPLLHCLEEAGIRRSS